ncbi:GNAT family N-acetyltransferase [Pararhizobium mangrovi]|uniref:GNAT family N-acetyltransferase n=1 Tax=Pararhizobium mangrovi TaxID=2590452 RepID=A0A506U6W9_9HYPH|nr:GNAT family protein [Pararhizobium mangrovi]TPW28695.1 GNAT family N-acetyltransferase [Pararhizobium mangrovi]
MTKSMLRFLSRPADDVVLQDRQVYLRVPLMADYPVWRDLRESSRSFLEPWEPTWRTDDLTRSAFRLRVRRHHRDHVQGTALPLFIFRADDHALLGGITLGHIRRGPAQSTMIGYWMGAPHAGHGFMRATLELVIPYAFDTMRLHRIEAACIPDNARSIGLLEKVGFGREGYLRSYLKINGAWRDHVLFARLAEEQRTARKASSVNEHRKTIAG